MNQQGIWIAVIILVIVLGLGGMIMYSQQQRKDGFTPTSALYDDSFNDNVEAVSDTIQLITDGELVDQPNMGVGPQGMGSSRVTNGGW